MKRQSKKAEWYSVLPPFDHGDHWQILISGMSGVFPRRDGKLQFARSGPYAPPIAICAMEDMIVTESAAAALRNLRGVRGFAPVIKRHIVKIDWSTWKVGDFRCFDGYGEPESAILDGEHDDDASEEMGDLFEVLLETDGEVREKFTADGSTTVTIRERPRRDFELFKAVNGAGGFHSVIAHQSVFDQIPPEMFQWVAMTPIAEPQRKR